MPLPIRLPWRVPQMEQKSGLCGLANEVAVRVAKSSDVKIMDASMTFIIPPNTQLELDKLQPAEVRGNT
jgi:hypothetical protein